MNKVLFFVVTLFCAVAVQARLPQEKNAHDFGMHYLNLGQIADQSPDVVQKIGFLNDVREDEQQLLTAVGYSFDDKDANPGLCGEAGVPLTNDDLLNRSDFLREVFNQAQSRWGIVLD
ncbi:hypothetical protein FJ366_03205 [Candidatus Dependentiae bacterium]|nr:hypothetical protein [Candidatus Dependentiae bacterium]